MKIALFIALFALLLALTGGVLVIVHDVHRDLSDFHSVLDQVGGATRAVEGTAKSLAGSAQDVQKIVGEERAAQKRQTDEFTKTIADFHDLLIHTDISLNGSKRQSGLLAHVDGILTHFDVTTLPALDMQIVGNGDQLQDTIARLGDSADGITGAAKTLDTQLSDPQIPQLIGHFNTISGNLADTTGDVQHEIHKFVYPPPRKWWQKYITDPANELREMFKFTHPIG